MSAPCAPRRQGGDDDGRAARREAAADARSGYQKLSKWRRAAAQLLPGGGTLGQYVASSVIIAFQQGDYKYTKLCSDFAKENLPPPLGQGHGGTRLERPESEYGICAVLGFEAAAEVWEYAVIVCNGKGPRCGPAPRAMQPASIRRPTPARLQPLWAKHKDAKCECCGRRYFGVLTRAGGSQLSSRPWASSSTWA
jgi:hypothetical protein